MTDSKKKLLSFFSVFTAISFLIGCAFVDNNLPLDQNTGALILTAQALLIFCALYKAFCQIWSNK
jgi:hypothetical protein